MGLDAGFILRELERNKRELRQLGVKRLGLFGSFLHGTQTSRSDVDFIAEFDRISFDSYMDLKFFLQKLFGKKVDLVTAGSLKPSLRYVRNKANYAAL